MRDVFYELNKRISFIICITKSELHLEAMPQRFVAARVPVKVLLFGTNNVDKCSVIQLLMGEHTKCAPFVSTKSFKSTEYTLCDDGLTFLFIDTPNLSTAESNDVATHKRQLAAQLLNMLHTATHTLDLVILVRKRDAAPTMRHAALLEMFIRRLPVNSIIVNTFADNELDLVDWHKLQKNYVDDDMYNNDIFEKVDGVSVCCGPATRDETRKLSKQLRKHSRELLLHAIKERARPGLSFTVTLNNRLWYWFVRLWNRLCDVDYPLVHRQFARNKRIHNRSLYELLKELDYSDREAANESCRYKIPEIVP